MAVGPDKTIVSYNKFAFNKNIFGFCDKCIVLCTRKKFLATCFHIYSSKVVAREIFTAALQKDKSNPVTFKLILGRAFQSWKNHISFLPVVNAR